MEEKNTGLSDKLCSICGELYEGFGNNAKPINDGRCCDACNDKVILARLDRLETIHVPITDEGTGPVEIPIRVVTSEINKDEEVQEVKE